MIGVLILLAAAPSVSPVALPDKLSAKPLAEFSACFANAQDRGGRAWAYLPSDHGGTFTDSGAYGAAATYWLRLRGLGGSTRIRVLAAAPRAVVEAVDRCR